jgi:hypothetical protein
MPCDHSRLEGRQCNAVANTYDGVITGTTTGRDKYVHLNRQPCYTSTTCLTSAWLDALATRMLKKRDRYRFCPCTTKATTDNANLRLLECPRSLTTWNDTPTRKYGLPEGIEEKARDHPSCGAYFQSTISQSTKMSVSLELIRIGRTGFVSSFV